MSGANGALQLIEAASAHLCRSIGESVQRLRQAMATAPDTNPPEQAARALDHQVKLLSAAWGAAQNPLSLSQLTALAQGLPAAVSVDVTALPQEAVFSASHGRIVLNLLLLAAESLPAGGHVILAGAADDLFLGIAGPDAAWPAGIAVCLLNEAEAQAALTDGRNLQMALTSILARAGNIRLSVLQSPAAHSPPAILRLGG